MEMKMDRLSLGFIELPNLCDAVTALDVMLKAAAVTFVSWEKRLGGRLVTIIVSGSVASVSAAVEAAQNNFDVRAALVLPSPHAEVLRILKLEV